VGRGDLSAHCPYLFLDPPTVRQCLSDVLSVLAAGDGAWCVLSVHPEHLRSLAVYSPRLDRRHRRLVSGVHHRFHVLRLRSY